MTRRAAKFAPAALTVASTDSGGNAGIMADLRVFRDFSVHACAAVASVTAQNPSAVLAVHPVPENVFRAQLEAVIPCYAIRAAKTGMLFSENLVCAAAEMLGGAKFPVVVDPVMVATSGAALLEPSAIEAVKKRLLPVAYAVTPNIPEAEILAERPVKSFRDAIDAARAIYDRYGCIVVLKGGHAAGAVPGALKKDPAWKFKGPVAVDIVCSGRGECSLLVSAKVRRPVSTHGTGCTLSAAIAAGLARGKGFAAAAREAKEYTARAIRDSHSVGPKAGVLA